jgi:hypothetical protein
MKLSLTIASLRVGSIAFLRGDERARRAQVARLARMLDRRIRDVLAGRIR